VSAWDAGQVRMFAKQVADKYSKAWFMIAPDARNALLSHHVLMIVFSQRNGTIDVDDVRELRIAIEERLRTHHSMGTNP
jgi:hypothetical protein